MSIAHVEVPIGVWGAPHLHTNTPELAVVLEGSTKVGLQPPQKDWLEVTLEAGTAYTSRWAGRTGFATRGAVYCGRT